jgi:DNA-binding PadR family transcriptional regulator
VAGQETRLLLLGAVALFGPVNGYQIRRELLSWQVDRWAHVNPGSIYHGLASLARSGHLVRHDLVDGTREVAVYEVTDTGREELHRLLVEGLETVDVHDRTLFTVAFSQLPQLPTDQVLRSLVVRRRGLEAEVARLSQLPRSPGPDDPAPPHAMRMQLLWLDAAIAELAWLRETIDQLRAGELVVGGPDRDGWVPPPDDPGWQMQRDRERYLALLGRS